MDTIYKAFDKNPALQHLLLDEQVQQLVNETVSSTRDVVAQIVSSGISAPSFANTLAYFDALRTENMPSNLIQAQRDYFGAHTYELVGKEGSFHSEWKYLTNEN